MTAVCLLSLGALREAIMSSTSIQQLTELLPPMASLLSHHVRPNLQILAARLMMTPPVTTSSCNDMATGDVRESITAFDTIVMLLRNALGPCDRTPPSSGHCQQRIIERLGRFDEFKLMLR